jgi:ketosteroid isomerase-like protein
VDQHARARNGAPCDNDYPVVFHVTGSHIDAVTEYCDTFYMKQNLFGQ